MKTFQVGVYVIPLIFSIVTLFYDQFDWFHSLLLFLLSFEMTSNPAYKITIYSKTWGSETK